MGSTTSSKFLDLKENKKSDSNFFSVIYLYLNTEIALPELATHRYDLKILHFTMTQEKHFNYLSNQDMQDFLLKNESKKFTRI